MATARKAWDIGRRFSDEQDYIQRYVELLRAKSTLHDRQVEDLNRILKRVHLDQLPMRGYDRTGKPYSEAELDALLAAVRAVGPELYQTILGHEQSSSGIPSFGLDGPAAEYLERLDEWVDHFVPLLADDPEDEDEDGMIRLAFREAERIDAENEEDERIPPVALKALLDLAMENARHVWFIQRIDAMVYARQQFEEIEVLARMAAPDAEINVFRQGFILLMTAFDAAVTDLTRLALRGRFLEFASAVGKHERLTLESLGEAGTFPAFRDWIIEEQLKKRYVRDLLALLQSLGFAPVDEARGDRPVQLIELVLRRNIHVHNRGVVDERYLDADPATGKPRLTCSVSSSGMWPASTPITWRRPFGSVTHASAVSSGG